MPSNCDIIGNIILVATNAEYENSPPSEDQFHLLANTIRESMKPLYPISDEDFANILMKLRSLLVVKMDVGVYINDKDTLHQSWLLARKADLDMFFWKRYKKYLEIVKHWNTRTTATLDKVSDEIVDLLGDPNGSTGFQRRGLILGDVQSGKTANYTAVCNKAADAGYRVIIVLAGTLENLRQQTQSRLDAEFSGRRSEYYLDPNAEQVIKNTPVGVGVYGSNKRIASFTSVAKDFDINVLRSNDLAIQNVADPILLVVKKNKRILTNLINWLVKNNTNHITKKIPIPLLLIDDEADNASVNTREADDDPTAINGCIRKLLNVFDKASYLGITATPFANIFINPDSEDVMLGEDLFPRHFIYSLSAPSSYIGADEIFGEKEGFDNVLVPLKRDEMDAFFPFSHKKGMSVEELPASMKEAIRYFLLINAIRDFRGDKNKHRSMMIHVSRFTDVQDQITELINEWLVEIKSDVQHYSSLPEEKSDQISNIKALHFTWEKYGLERTSGLKWQDVLKAYLYHAISPVVVRSVNQRTGSASLDYFNHKQDGLRVIAVGGNSLSRGLTLEGLSVSYFYRKSQMYDTLLQMGRWFGYKPNYEDLFRIWIAEEAVDWYGYISRAANELKDEIAKMKIANQTPSEFGLKVRQDPNSLIVTARNKMRSASQVSRPVSVSGRLLETPRLKSDRAIMESNEHIFKEFVDSLAVHGTLDTREKEYYWRGVPKELIAQLLLDFETHPWHLAFQGKALSEYITEKMSEDKWDVALITDGEGRPYNDGFKYGDSILEVKATEKRNIVADEKMVRISGTKVRVGSGGCTKVGLSLEQQQAAIAQFKKRYGDKSVSDSAYLIKDRKPLLMLHVIDVALNVEESSVKGIPEFVFALGVGFPDTGDETKKAMYMVNMVELRNWIDIDEDEDE